MTPDRRYANENPAMLCNAKLEKMNSFRAEIVCVCVCAGESWVVLYKVL